MLKRSSRIIGLYIVVVLVSSCAATATGKKFVLENSIESKAVIYHYRESAFKGSALSYDVLSNEKPLTRIGNGGYFRELSNPGPIEYRTLVSSDKGPILFIDNIISNSFQDFEKAYSLTVEAGKKYYLRWTPKIFGGPPEIVLVEEREAIDEIKELRAYPPAKNAQNSSK